MDYNTINPYVCIAQNSILLYPCSIATRRIPNYELIYIEKGRFKLVYNETSYICEEGTALLIHPGVDHSITLLGSDVGQPHSHFYLQYEDYVKRPREPLMNSDDIAQAIRVSDALSELLPSPILSVPDKTRFLSVFYKLIEEFQAQQKQSSLSIRAQMLYLLDMILPTVSKDGSKKVYAMTEIESIKNFIDANCQTELSLKDLQSRFYFGTSFMEQKFKDKYGISIMRYYKRAKMEKAKNLLKRPNVTVTLVSEYLCYSSTAVFSRAFKNMYGISPQQFQKDFRKA